MSALVAPRCDAERRRVRPQPAVASGPSDGQRLRVLAFSSLFPNEHHPLTGVFVAERVRALARLCDVRVVAPVPWAPAAPGLPERYRRYSRVPGHGCYRDLQVLHPRFVVLPKVLKPLDGGFMAACCRGPVAQLRRTFPFDVIDAHWACPDGVAAALLARHFNVPLSITVRGDDINIFAEEIGRRQAIRWALRQADIIVALSSDLKHRVERLGVPSSKVTVIPNGIDPDRFRPSDRLDARRRLGLPSHERLLLSAGRLHTSKSYPVVVEALGRLRTRFPDLRLVIVGPPDPEADATAVIVAAADRAGVSGRVHLAGPVPQETLVDWYAAADVFCLATTREGSANVLLEALACGVPCVTTPVGGNPDAVPPEAGVLTAPESEAMADAISAALSRRWDRQRISAMARLRTWGVVAEECHRELVGATIHARQRLA